MPRQRRRVRDNSRLMDLPLYSNLREVWFRAFDDFFKRPSYPAIKEVILRGMRKLEGKIRDTHTVRADDLEDAIKTIAFLQGVSEQLLGRIWFYQEKLAQYEPRYREGLPEDFQARLKPHHGTPKITWLQKEEPYRG